MAAGYDYSAILRSDGGLIMVGGGSDRCILNYPPTLPDGRSWVQYEAAQFFIVLLRDDGHAFAYAPYDDERDPVNGYGCLEIPVLPDGLTYSQVSAGAFHLALLRSDGEVIIGNNDYSSWPEKVIPSEFRDNDVKYKQVSSGYYLDAILLSSGHVLVYDHAKEKCFLDSPADSLEYVDIAAGKGGVALLRSDGRALWLKSETQVVEMLPDLPEGVRCVRVIAGVGEAKTVALLQSDGQVTLVGFDGFTLPKLRKGWYYVDGSIGQKHVIFLSTDGCTTEVVAVGCNEKRQCDIPKLTKSLSYVLSCTRRLDIGGRVAELCVEESHENGEIDVVFKDICGEKLCVTTLLAASTYGIDLYKLLSKETETCPVDWKILLKSVVLSRTQGGLSLADLLCSGRERLVDYIDSTLVKLRNTPPTAKDLSQTVMPSVCTRIRSLLTQAPPDVLAAVHQELSTRGVLPKFSVGLGDFNQALIAVRGIVQPPNN